MSDAQAQLDECSMCSKRRHQTKGCKIGRLVERTIPELSPEARFPSGGRLLIQILRNEFCLKRFPSGRFIQNSPK